MPELQRSVITLLALINPVVCAVMLRQCTPGASRRQRLRGVLSVVLRTGLILLVSVAIGPRLLHTFGISLDVFRIVGGLVIALIGYGMFENRSAAADGDPIEASEVTAHSVERVVLFAASPGTVASVVTLSVLRGPGEGPLAASAAVLLALLITALAMAALVLRPGEPAPGGSSIVTRFLGLILIAMGLQLALTNLRDFFGIRG